jgi:hypothetical protein
MTQDERWMNRYREVMGFMDKNHQNPSKHRSDEHQMVNWLKQQRKLMNAGRLKRERVGLMLLRAVAEQYKHKNQHDYPE